MLNIRFGWAVLWVLVLGSAVAEGAGPPTLNDLVTSSDIIVEGKVAFKETVQERIAVNENGDQADLVFTFLEIASPEYHKGTQDEKVIVRLIGGVVGDWALVDADGPSISDGDDAVFFLRDSELPRPSTNEDTFILPYAKLGQFDLAIEGGKKVVHLPHSVGSLGITTEESISDQTLDYVDFKKLLSDMVEFVTNEESVEGGERPIPGD